MEASTAASITNKAEYVCVIKSMTSCGTKNKSKALRTLPIDGVMYMYGFNEGAGCEYLKILFIVIFIFPQLFYSLTQWES